jgi:hypothetical protein
MAIIKNSLVAVLALACAACMHDPAPPSASLMFLPDVSKSIEESARGTSLRAIETASAQLGRGGAFDVIPITSDAAESAPGEILRFRFAADRQPFDSDLAEVLSSEHAGLARIGAHSAYERTDIFGTLALAEEELAHAPRQNVRAIVVLSDFVEDDGRYEFISDRRLRNSRAAKDLAAELARRSTDLHGVTVYLGELPSVSLKKVPQTRREAIKVFWLEYLGSRGAQVEWATDGDGELTGFVERLVAGTGGSRPVASIVGADTGARSGS